MTERIKYLIEFYQLTPSKFADEINIQRSAISHILSGRNKPSLDVVQKILLRFPEVNPEWLLMGKGLATKEKATAVEKNIPIEKTKVAEKQLIAKKKVGKIIVLYTDHTFEEFQKSE